MLARCSARALCSLRGKHRRLPAPVRPGNRRLCQGLRPERQSPCAFGGPCGGSRKPEPPDSGWALRHLPTIPEGPLRAFGGPGSRKGRPRCRKAQVVRQTQVRPAASSLLRPRRGVIKQHFYSYCSIIPGSLIALQSSQTLDLLSALLIGLRRTDHPSLGTLGTVRSPLNYTPQDPRTHGTRFGR